MVARWAPIPETLFESDVRYHIEDKYSNYWLLDREYCNIPLLYMFL